MSAQLDNLPWHRPMRLADVELVAEVERDIYPFPWTRGNFIDSLRASYSCWVMEMQGELAGYGIMMVAAQESHLLNLSVARAWQGQQLGRRLLEHFLALSRDYGSRIMLLEVRPSNDAACRLYRSAGFRLAGIRPNYYPADKGREDALVMEKVL